MPHSQPQRVPPLRDDGREAGQPPGVHLDPLVEVVPARAPRPIVEVVLADTCLREADVLVTKAPGGGSRPGRVSLWKLKLEPGRRGSGAER